MYLIDLRIDLRDPASGRLIASGHSYQTSLARKDPEAVVNQVIDGMLGEQPLSK